MRKFCIFDREWHTKTLCRRFSGLLLLSFLSACGGGGGGPNVPSDDTGSSGADPFPPVTLNGALTGHIFETGKASYFDLDSGETVQLAGDSAYPSRDGTEIVELHENFRFMPDGGCYSFAVHHDLILFRDVLTGRTTDSFEIPEDIYGPIKLSPDGQTLALYWSKSHTCYDEDTAVTILSRTGEEIIRGSEDINSFDWLPDNRLVFALDQKIGVEVQRNTFRYNTIADMSNVAGSPGRVAVSPDGSEVMFEMITQASSWLSTVSFRNATVWAVNIDGSNLRRVATSSRVDEPDHSYDDPQVNMPVWSPDGSTTLLTENYTSGGIILTDDAFVVLDYIPVSNQGLTYALPADIPEQFLPPATYSTDAVRPLIGKQLDGRQIARALNPFDQMMWSPASPAAPLVSGALPPYNSLPNRGLSGRIYLMDDNSGDYDEPVMKVLDLASGAIGIYTDFNDDQLSFTSSITAVSADAQLTAHHVYESIDEQYLRIYDASGERLQSLSFITNDYYYEPESPLQFSPVNNDHIAWIHDDDNFGTGAIVLDLASKRFVAHWTDLDYDALAWTREGDMLLFDEGRAYRSRLDNGTFGNPELLFDFGEAIRHPDVSPANNDIAFSAGGQIFAIGLDGQNARRMTAPTDLGVYYPSWSPDGQYLSVKKDRRGYVIAADALNVRLYEDHRSVGGFQLGESTGTLLPANYGRLAWR